MPVTEVQYAVGTDLGQLATDVTAKIALGLQPVPGAHPTYAHGLWVREMQEGTAPSSVDEVVADVSSLQDTQVFLGPEVDLSSVDILALDSVEIELAPAPGEGFAIVPHEVRWFLDYDSVAYTGGAPQLYYTDLSGTEIGALAVAFWRASADRQAVQMITEPGGAFAFQLTENAPVVLASGSAFADGDSPVRIQLAYRKVAILGAPTP